MSIFIPTWVNGELCAIEKLEAHQRGLRHKAVSVFVLCGGEVLMQQRAWGKYHTPGLWTNTCCTHPFWDESAGDCAIRRLNEELGISGVALQHKQQIEYRADVGGGLIEHELVDIFVAKVEAAPQLSINPDEVAATRWQSLAALREDIHQNPAQYTPWLQIYLAQHCEAIFAEAALH